MKLQAQHLSSAMIRTTRKMNWTKIKMLTGSASIALALIRECSSTLYVGLARTAPPTNTNFGLTFLLNQLQEARYEDLAV